MKSIKIFLSGSVKKGDSDKRQDDYFWADFDIDNLSSKISFPVTFLDPNKVDMDFVDGGARFEKDLQMLLCSDIVLIDMNKKKGIGVGSEMLLAKLNNIPIYSICPMNSHYRNNENGFEWIHPFVSQLSDMIFDSVDSFINYINYMFDKQKISFNKFTDEQIQDKIDALRSFDAGYDEGYKRVDLFWGEKPAGFVKLAADYVKISSKFANAVRCIDLGCGHGKNSVFLADYGYNVTGIDASIYSIQQARKLSHVVNWKVEDIRKAYLQNDYYNIVLMTGPLHCFDNREQIMSFINRAKNSTVKGGYNVLSVFNDRIQDFSGHSEDFKPTLLPHIDYMNSYSDWDIIEISDSDLEDIHPHNNITHLHSITRILAYKP